MKKVVKFGGSSLASAEQFKKVGDIIRADEGRRYVVPSAPGKRNSADTKVTDMLYDCYRTAVAGRDFKKKLQNIKARYQEIIDGLNLSLDLSPEFEKIAENFAAAAGEDYAASRGEYLNGIVMANYLGYTYIDSAEVIHGLFSMKGKVDSVVMATLYIGDESIMPLVIEKGNIQVSITNTELVAKGTSLNNALYAFIDKKNSLDIQIEELQRKEARMVMDGADLADIHEQLTHEGDSLMQDMNGFIKKFISDNYETVLGPSVFMMLCSTLPYPVMTPQIEDIMKDAPYSFKNNKLVKDFITKAKSNMELIEEHQRMEQNATLNR